MAIEPKAYVQQIRALLPNGPAWPRDDDTSAMAMLIECWANEFSRIDSRAHALLTESDPRSCTETFREWLTQWGVPDPCLELWGSLTETGLTEKTLREALVEKISVPGGQNLAFFVRLALNYGYKITIDELRPHTVMSRVIEPFSGDGWTFRWRVQIASASAATVNWHDAVGTCNEPLAWWGDSVIECLIKRYAPAHTEVSFSYLGI